MNPWAFLVILLGILLIIIGVKGSQHNIIAAITGHASGSTSGSTSTGSSPAVTPLPQNLTPGMPNLGKPA